MDYCAALCMMIMASIFLSGLGWVVLQASFVGWVGLDHRKWTHVHDCCYQQDCQPIPGYRTMPAGVSAIN